MAARKKVSQVSRGKKTETSQSVQSRISSLNPLKRFSNRTRMGLVALLGLAILLLLGARYMVIAWVDNKPVTRLEYYQNLDKRYGKDMREELIVEKLLTSEANKRKVSVTNGEIDQEIKKIEEQQGGAEQLDQILQAQNITRDDFRKLVRLQLLKQKIFGGGVNITEEDVNKYMEENKQSLPPDFAEGKDSSESAKLRENIKEQLKQQKVNTEFNNWLTQALQSSRVTRN